VKLANYKEGMIVCIPGSAVSGLATSAGYSPKYNKNLGKTVGQCYGDVSGKKYSCVVRWWSGDRLIEKEESLHRLEAKKVDQSVLVAFEEKEKQQNAKI